DAALLPYTTLFRSRGRAPPRRRTVGAVVVAQRVADDPPGVVLPGVERAEVEVVELRPELRAHPFGGVGRQAAQVAHQAAELLRVLRQTLGTDEDDRQQGDDRKLGPVDRHDSRIVGRQSLAASSRTTSTSRSCPSSVRTVRTTVSPGARERTATMSSDGDVTGCPS